MFFFFNDTATTEIYTLSLHDALPIYRDQRAEGEAAARQRRLHRPGEGGVAGAEAGRQDQRHQRREVADRLRRRSEEHTSELQSRQYLVCRLLLEKKKNIQIIYSYSKS